MPRLHRFFLGLLLRLPLFRRHRRLLLAFLFRVALFGHTVRFLSVTLQIHVQDQLAVPFNLTANELPFRPLWVERNGHSRPTTKLRASRHGESG